MLKKLILIFLLLSIILIPLATTKKQSNISSKPVPKQISKRIVKKHPMRPNKPTVVNGPNGCKRVILTGAASSALTPLQTALRAHSVGRPKNISLEIDKSQRLMKLFVDGNMVKSYPVGLGKVPDGPKIRQGDRHTPEGKYYVCEKNPRSRFYLSLKISYPNISDAQRGLEDGLINQSTYQRIVNSINTRTAPPMNTRLGGNICIHSGGAGKLYKNGSSKPYMDIRDWTAGCVALEKSDIQELFNFIPVGTPVIIRA